MEINIQEPLKDNWKYRQMSFSIVVLYGRKQTFFSVLFLTVYKLISLSKLHLHTQNSFINTCTYARFLATELLVALLVYFFLLVWKVSSSVCGGFKFYFWFRHMATMSKWTCWCLTGIIFTIFHVVFNYIKMLINLDILKQWTARPCNSADIVLSNTVLSSEIITTSPSFKVFCEEVEMSCTAH